MNTIVAELKDAKIEPVFNIQREGISEFRKNLVIGLVLGSVQGTFMSETTVQGGISDSPSSEISDGIIEIKKRELETELKKLTFPGHRKGIKYETFIDRVNKFGEGVKKIISNIDSTFPGVKNKAIHSQYYLEIYENEKYKKLYDQARNHGKEIKANFDKIRATKENTLSEYISRYYLIHNLYEEIDQKMKGETILSTSDKAKSNYEFYAHYGYISAINENKFACFYYDYQDEKYYKQECELDVKTVNYSSAQLDNFEREYYNYLDEIVYIISKIKQSEDDILLNELRKDSKKRLFTGEMIYDIPEDFKNYTEKRAEKIKEFIKEYNK